MKNILTKYKECIIAMLSFIFLLIVIWLDELIDLPYSIMHAHKTPINWQESILETILLTLTATITILKLKDVVDKRIHVQNKLVKLQEDLKLEKYKLEQVLNIDSEISSLLRLNQLVDFVVDQATKILNAERCSLMLLDESTQELIIRGAKGIDDQIVRSTRIPVGHGIAGSVAKNCEPMLVEDADKSSLVKRNNDKRYKSKSFIVAPIKLHDRLVGTVSVTEKRAGKEEQDFFSDVDLKILCNIIHQAAISIENANYYQELEFLTRTDFLTGLYNHRHFIVSLDKEVERSKRYACPLCLMMIDIDNFKGYNDAFGHVEGDNLLKSFGKVLKSETRSVDIVCRYAGDEFAVILPETDIEQSKILANKIKVKFEHLKLKKKVTTSLGLSQFGSSVSDRLNIILKADQALYKAKKDGKNTIAYL